MGIDSRIEVTIEVPMATKEAKSLPNTLIGLAGGPGIQGGRSIEITYPIFDGRRRALHGAIYKIARDYGLVEDDDDCVGQVDLFGRWGKVTDAQRGGALLNALMDVFLYSDDLDMPDLMEALRHLSRLPANVMRITYHWC